MNNSPQSVKHENLKNVNKKKGLSFPGILCLKIVLNYMLKYSKKFDGVHFERRKKDEINDDLSGKRFLKSSLTQRREKEETPLVVEMSWNAKQKGGGKHSSIT